ncbi:uncharacterized protein FMAN_15495 [Fusarium mangiferae]|uniref:Uncharacterized protein n=1 Tax=Fusarium mangiferae TaxID=192010 RepID=A0A1L7UP75_FUSMA|nr:uncharacterized protein FMAN_15495 [Fusarium mangiferae]CVL09331.1 uncharacterized protein FMAN_15495 [Fusarium mangiferae]
MLGWSQRFIHSFFRSSPSSSSFPLSHEPLWDSLHEVDSSVLLNDLKKSYLPLACIENPGPNRLDCPSAIAAWSGFTDDDGNVTIDAGTCRSTTYGNCQAVVCAPKARVVAPLEQMRGPMWTHITARCVSGGAGGVWFNEDLEMMIELRRPQDH